VDGSEAGVTGMLAMQHVAAVRGESTRRRSHRVSPVRRGVGVGLVRLGERVAGPVPAT
jgi:hypothetical protein